MGRDFAREVTAAGRLDILSELVERGDLTLVTVEGWKGEYHVVTADRPLLEAVAQGGIPGPWKAPANQASFLSPLEPVSARGRAKQLFGFDYVWEIYKRPADVKYGRFTMPILWNDRLVGRMDAKIDRSVNTVVVNGVWLEDEADPQLGDFMPAIAHEFERLRTFLGAERVDLSAAGGSAAALPHLRG
jgi:uncharacterized protein YcaQ